MTDHVFARIADRRIFKEVIGQLRTGLIERRLAAGDRLPSERDLAEQFGISRTSVREALRVLEALGVVSVRPGAENGAILLDGPGSALGDLLEFQLALRNIEVVHILEFRRVIESWAAGAAAERACEEELAELKAIVDEMAQPQDQEQFEAVDATFHLTLARLSGNGLLVLILEGARSAIERLMHQAISSAGEWEPVRDRLVAEHSEIYAAIAARDASLASSLVDRHIEGFYTQPTVRDVFATDRVPPGTTAAASGDGGGEEG
ncbi:MAG TPA: FCD domain-containing protein [Gaiellaceae bacterium]|nr:FCD domain-containing protein [Gaiellaceae bacterium]